MSRGIPRRRAVSGGEDHATWTAPAAGAEAALQRDDGDGAWQQVSPWLPPTVDTYTLPSGPAGRAYRLALRADRDRQATGPAVTPS